MTVIFCPNCGRTMQPTALTLREIEVLRLAGAGKKTGEIAKIMFVSTHTIDSHRRNLLSKLGVGTMAAAALWAVKEGLLKP